MVWRIHFTPADLEHTRIGPALSPIGETTMAMSLLWCPYQSRTLFSPWRNRSCGRLTAQMKPLVPLVPKGTRGIDLQTLTGGMPTIEQGVQGLLSTPRDSLLAELEALHRVCALPRSAWDVADPDTDARRRLAGAVHATYRALVEPYWPRVDAQLRAEQALHSRTLRLAGADRLLAGLQSQRIRWHSPVLEVLLPGSVETRLSGRGLVIVPSVFVGEIPALLSDPNSEDAPPQLIVPAVHDSRGDHLWAPPRPAAAALAALMGRTRAAVLSTIADGCTTTELAGRAGISPASASQHATVLRDAGLITTSRQGSAVLHMLTPLGASLLKDEQER